MVRLEDLKLQELSCIRNDGHQTNLNKNISLYVVATRKCNAACEFCEYRGDVEEVDIDTFKKVYDTLQRKYDVNMVHFTGGEPTLKLDTIKQVCRIVKQENDMAKTSVNTNGLYLNELAKIADLDNVALSRHGITDEDNFKIFHTNTIASKKDILEFPKAKLHLSCNLIRGYVDGEERVYEYLDNVADMGIFDVGFVGLMKINPYCKEKFVEYPKLSKCTYTSDHKNIVDGQCVCKCQNYLYRAKNHNIVSIYERNVLKSTPFVSYLVYENNKLRVGFNGDYVSLT